MASASSTDTAPKTRTMSAETKRDLARRRKAKPKKAASAVRVLFLPGSLNDQLSKLSVGESYARCKRIPLENGNVAAINDEAKRYFQNQNSILSGGIAKVRGAPEHKDKRFRMERGTYMNAGNDAMFAFVTITRSE